MGSYETTIGILADELKRVEQAFRGLSPDEWRAPTKLVPVDPSLPHWTVFELAGHFDISIGLTRMLIDGKDDLQPARDRTSFFINPRSETAPVVYDYAYTMVQDKTPADMPHVLHETFSLTLSQAGSVPPARSAPGTSPRCGWTSSWQVASSRPSCMALTLLRPWTATRSRPPTASR